MATFQQIQQSVSKRLLDANNTAISVADVAASINDAIRYWKTRRFWFNEEYYTGTLVAQDATIPLPSDFLVTATDYDGFVIHYSSMRYPLTKITQQQYDGIFLDNGFGLPYCYARMGQDYQVYFSPDRDYEFVAHYLKDYVDLVDPNETNDFTDYADRLITLWTCANMSAEFRQDDKMEGYYRKAAEDEYRQLGVRTAKSNASGRLTIRSTL
jgi:hypothetical protein